MLMCYGSMLIGRVFTFTSHTIYTSVVLKEIPMLLFWHFVLLSFVPCFQPKIMNKAPMVSLSLSLSKLITILHFDMWFSGHLVKFLLDSRPRRLYGKWCHILCHFMFVMLWTEMLFWTPWVQFFAHIPTTSQGYCPLLMDPLNNIL